MKSLQPLIDLKQSLTRKAYYIAVLASVSALAVFPCWQLAAAAGGDLDPSFGGSGIVFIRPQGISGDGPATTAALQPDGKIVVVTTLSGPRLVLVRLNSDGSIDNAFGAGGKIMTSFPGRFSLARDIIFQPDWKLVVVGKTMSQSPGETQDDFALARYYTDGTFRFVKLAFNNCLILAKETLTR